MPIARFKDLCIDALDPGRLGSFWAETLGLDLTMHDDGDAHLAGPTPQHAIWVNRVPEPVTAKQRVHLDVHAGSTAEVLRRGATLVEELERWDLLQDPEGGELCVFTRQEVPAYKLYELVVDAVDHRAIADWWAEVLGARVVDGDGFCWLEDVAGLPFESWDFGSVPEPKTVKNRIHWDLVVPDEQALVAHGARVLAERTEATDWTVMADPEGNEFCTFLPADDPE